jgi:hypothetical protein
VLLSPVGGIVPFRRGVVIKMVLVALFPVYSHIARLVLQPFFAGQVVLNDCFIRLKRHYRWAWPPIVTDLILMEIGDFPMMHKCLLGIKQRAERSREQIAK